MMSTVAYYNLAIFLYLSRSLLLNFNILVSVSHYWCTQESPREHVAKFFGRLWLIRSVLRTTNSMCLQIDGNCNFVG